MCKWRTRLSNVHSVAASCFRTARPAGRPGLRFRTFQRENQGMSTKFRSHRAEPGIAGEKIALPMVHCKVRACIAPIHNVLGAKRHTHLSVKPSMQHAITLAQGILVSVCICVRAYFSALISSNLVAAILQADNACSSQHPPCNGTSARQTTNFALCVFFAFQRFG